MSLFALHEQIAARDLCGGYAAGRPDAAADILFGAACCLALDDLLATRLLPSWQAGRPSLQRRVAGAGEMIVVDGSAEVVFARHLRHGSAPAHAATGRRQPAVAPLRAAVTGVNETAGPVRAHSKS